MFRFHLFFYLELRLRPDGTLTSSESRCRSCAQRLQVPYQRRVRRKCLNQKCEPLTTRQNAHIWSMGAALMRALANCQPSTRSDKLFGTLAACEFSAGQRVSDRRAFFPGWKSRGEGNRNGLGTHKPVVVRLDVVLFSGKSGEKKRMPANTSRSTSPTNLVAQLDNVSTTG